ncbi:NAD+ synthase [Halovenus sp. WSH3]|uniref:NH(3)-dependent NAD(+) synthetase n=1 Tax=Halovenus carboxidivorans TaxID=2692199 RepID=A0A6B0T6I6_9EURY|nr:NAD+ synthase [Halovenus carboxidivorans]MXR51183.1 NAD+ synthase [Halovenus carboxidivorans]
MTETASADAPLDLRLSEAELEQHRGHITSFITDQYEAAGADVAVIALSGGIDSTLTSHLAVEALGTANVYGLVLPSTVNREQNMSDAERVASELLDIEYDVIEIQPLVEAVLEANPNVSIDAGEDDQTRVAVGNLRARLRAVTSYFEANRRNGIVLGTGNRSEAAVGYFTKYGDGAVDCHPIANLYKGQVRQLARHVGVPEDLAAKTASAELWADQTDEDELGLDYETLDSILALHVDGPLSATATAREIGVDTALVEDVRALYETSAHKRQAPPGPEPLY